MKHITPSDLALMSRFYRGNLINCLTGPKPSVLCGTKSEKGESNLALFTNVFHLGADPALIGYIQRPIGENGHSYENIINTKSYTFNLVSESMIDQAHQTSAKYDRQISEFTKTGLTEFYIDNFSAPFVQESKVKIGLQFVEAIPVSYNNTIIVIGKIENIFLDENALQEDGNILLNNELATSVVGLENYYGINFLKHKGYAKVDI